jgi:hypothetical protein
VYPVQRSHSCVAVQSNIAVYNYHVSITSIMVIWNYTMDCQQYYRVHIPEGRMGWKNDYEWWAGKDLRASDHGLVIRGLIYIQRLSKTPEKLSEYSRLRKWSFNSVLCELKKKYLFGIIVRENKVKPITVTSQSKAKIVFSLSNIGIIGSNTTLECVYLWLLCLCCPVCR